MWFANSFPIEIKQSINYNKILEVCSFLRIEIHTTTELPLWSLFCPNAKMSFNYQVWYLQKLEVLTDSTRAVLFSFVSLLEVLEIIRQSWVSDKKIFILLIKEGKIMVVFPWKVSLLDRIGFWFFDQSNFATFSLIYKKKIGGTLRFSCTFSILKGFSKWAA